MSKNWYKKIISESKLLETWWNNLEDKKALLEEDVNIIATKLYEQNVKKDCREWNLKKKIDTIIDGMEENEGEGIKKWDYLKKEQPEYIDELKKAVCNKYEEIYEKLEKGEAGPLQIQTPQTKQDAGGGMGGGMPQM